ncbi:MAG TPA: cytochrome c oxidase assembly protein [Candidatus Methylomirabilis sp.]|nr:cytochrome c oxidase assembly protein [Candidatus Methylomirabilis sp.]
MAHATLSPSWGFEPSVVVPLGLAAAIYARGWMSLHCRAPHRFGMGRLAAFLAGLATLAVALASPLHALGAVLLQAHMTQHLLLMMVAPPLLWLGAPLLPILRGLPRGIVRAWLIPLLVWPPLLRLGRAIAYPAVAWVLFVGCTWAWHMPALYERALASEGWHYAQHACFLGTGLAFWWPVVQPWPSRRAWPAWSLIPYLVLADLQNTFLSAWLAFSDQVIYPAYEAVPRLWGVSALADQAAAGAIMWVPGSLAFLVPTAWIALRLLTPKARAAAHGGSLRTQGPRISALGATSQTSFPRSPPL